LWGLSLPLAWLPLPRLGADQRDNAPYCENSVGTGSIFVEMILLRCQEDDKRVPGVDELVPRDVRGFEKAGDGCRIAAVSLLPLLELTAGDCSLTVEVTSHMFAFLPEFSCVNSCTV